MRIEWGSHLSLGQCVCIGKDEYRVILITLILSDYPYVKHILSLQMIYHIVLMHYVGCAAIKVVPGSSLLTISTCFNVTTSIVAMKSNFTDR